MKLINIIWTAVTIFLTGIGLLSLSSDLIAIDQHLGNWVTLWQNVNYYVWAPIRALVPVGIPEYVSDYLSVGVLFFASLVKVLFSESENRNRNFYEFLIHEAGLFLYLIWIILVWPVMLLWPFFVFTDKSADNRFIYNIFFYIFIGFLFLLAVNYYLLQFR